MNQKKDFLLRYDTDRWQERLVVPENTLQLFITDRCNRRCRGCFYSQRLGRQDMSFGEYCNYVDRYKKRVNKVTLLGGEPTLHKKIADMIWFNATSDLKTTIYTNGSNLEPLRYLLEDLSPQLRNFVSIRIGVHGLTVSEKPLVQVVQTSLPVTIVYMLAQYNVHELEQAAKFTEETFNCVGFYISSIRDVAQTGDYWLDTDQTIPIQDYAIIVQNFLDGYKGNIATIHISTRGVLITEQQDFCETTTCRFGNLMRDGSKIICPLDISLNKTSSKLVFGKRPCQRHDKCVLQKIVLERKQQTAP